MEQCSFQHVQKKTSSMSVTISSSASSQRELSSSASSQRELSSSASSQRELSSSASSQRELSSSASSQRELSSSASSQRELASSASSQRELSSSASSQRELLSQTALSSVCTSSGPLSSVCTSSGPLSSVVTSSGPLSSSASVLTQRHSDLLQPVCVSPQSSALYSPQSAPYSPQSAPYCPQSAPYSPQSAPYSPQSAPYSPQCSSSRGAPSFVKTLHDVSSVKGQLVVLECRLRGTPPLQVLWYREDEQILDSDDFRILRKKASSASVPEELCTLVITEAFPEDSGLYRCVALNSYGSVSCSSVLEVYNDLEEQLEMEALRQQESVPGPDSDPGPDPDPELDPGPNPDLELDPRPDPDPEWPESPPEDTLTSDFPDQSPEDSERSEVTVREATPTPPPPPSPPDKSKEKKLFTPSKLSFTSGSSTMNLSDLPTFSPSSFPSTGFNYERPRHFIQSQPAFQVPSYDSVLQDTPPTASPPLAPPTASPPLSPTVSCSHSSIAVSKSSAETGAVLQVSHSHASQTQSHASQTQSHTSQMQVCQSETRSFTQTQSQFQSMSLSELQSNGTSVALPSSVAPPPFQAPPSLLLSSSSHLPRPTVRSSLTLTPTSPSASVGLGSASLPANQDAAPAAAYLCSVLPGSKSPSRSPLMPNRMAPPLTPNATPPTPKATPHSPKTMPFSPTTTPLSPTAMPFSPTATPFSPTATPLTPTATPLTPTATPLTPTAMPLTPTVMPRSQQEQQNLQNLNRVQPTVVSLPASYKATPTILPKPILKKTIAPRPSSARSTDDDIQGSKDALIQDLEKKLRSKEARRRTGQKLSYEERMARRLLGPDSATYMFDQELLDSVDQPDSLEGRHIGGLWGRHHSAADEKTNEGSAIQEKCYAPRFLQIPPDLTVEEGRFCRIDFKVGGLPTPDVCWYLDGKAIRPDDYHKMLVCEKGMHSFIIEIVTVHHAGVYECVAQNRAGESRFSMRLDVIAQEALRPPTFVQKMLNSRALEGDTVRLECKVDASPPPQLFWKKDKDMLRIDPQRMSLYQDGSGRQCLLIERVVKSDAGWYTLSAINEAGMSTCNARLDISSRSTPPMKTAPPASKTLKLLSSLSQVSLNADGPSQHTAPLYESEEL